MSDNQNWNSVGDQIKDALQDALDSGDFKNLNSVVAGTVNSALTEAKRQMKIAAGSMKDAGWNGGAGPGGNGTGSWQAGQDPYGNGGSYTGGQGASGNGGTYTGGRRSSGGGSYTGGPGYGSFTGSPGGPGSGSYKGGSGGPGSGSYTGGPGGPGSGSFTGGPGGPGSGSYTGGSGGPGSGSFTGSPGGPGNGGFKGNPGGPGNGSFAGAPGNGGFTKQGTSGNGSFWNHAGGGFGGGQGAQGGNRGWNPGAAGQAYRNWNTSKNRNFGAWSKGSYNNWNYNKPKDTFHYNKSAPGGVYTGSTQKQTSSYQSRANQNNTLPAVRTRKVGQISGTLYIVFGGIGTGIMGCALAILIILFFAMQAFPILPVVVVALLLLCFVSMIERGCVKKERLKRAQRYIQLCDGKTYINIEDLAMHLSKSKRAVLKDVRKMLKLGIFPEGHLDEKETCLMLDDATYREYLRLQKERRVQEMEDKMARMRDNQKKGTGSLQEEREKHPAASIEPEQEKVVENAELEALIADGMTYIRKLRDYNDSIEGEVISSKLFQLEALLKEIFDRVREHPEQMPQMHKFMDYYLPTTIKLVQAYEEFDSVSVPGEDIISAKDEIEKTLDTINSAFTELLNNLFRDTVFDVTTDAQVLQTMLAKEGLMREMELEKVPR